ncbi:D-alanine--poly(phosphoribitol) ligase subunit DltC [Lacticaseibacillus parakribbianus]|uniref:D-alanine--poly(phosphoribitol) ligase subunit DltC n=1 Tax=Lacticaseibacillus parakribbianus TaxID=2970927 RepID=UPI0021CB2EA1|nr:D-alanine--poly(phosphoribitol) ligase subunit DltC [Lacticaseibacillus parakribbianus]
MDIQKTVFDILQDLTGTDFTGSPDENLFETGTLDSMDTVQLLLALQDQLGITVPVSEFDRSEWETPAKIAAKAASLQ